jgi:tight adherence protein B
MNIIFVYAAVFVAALILVDAFARNVFSSAERTKAINYRMKLLEGGEDHTKVYQGMLRERALLLEGDGRTLMQRILIYYGQSGLKFDAKRYLLYGAAGAVVLWLGATYFFATPLIRILVFIAFCIATPIFIIWRIRARRIAAFTLKLPEALDVANRSLAAGHPLAAAITLVSREMPDPVGSEFGILADEMTYGVELETALANMGERVGAEDLNFLTISLSVQRGTGGNLVEILGNLSGTLRARSMLRAKVRAISSEGRITAIFMSMFPFFLYMMIVFMSPTYFDPVWQSGYAYHILAVGAVIMAIGNTILYKMVNFEF